MKKNAIYIGILLIGVLLGGFLFGKSSANKPLDKHEKTAKIKQMWTCSMHPQIMKSQPGKCPICAMNLIPVKANATDGLLANQFKMTKNAMALANVETSIVGSAKFKNNSINLSGKIVENEETNLVQVSYFSGRIEKLAINFKGKKVNKGQQLAVIYSPKLVAAQQELITAVSLKKSEPALYKAVRNKLKLWKLSEKQINQIETSKKVREKFPIYATISGTVSQKLVEQGDYIKQGQPLLKISNLNTVWANFDVYENQINLFKKGQTILISTNAYPTKKFSAKVSFIDPVLNTETRTVKLRVLLNNKKAEFKPGMFVQGKISGIKKEMNQSIVVPASAVLWTGNRSVVYLKTNPNSPVFEMREITAGRILGDRVEVTSGLKDGDEIVTNGTFTVDAASQLQGKKSMMNQDKYEILTNGSNNSEKKQIKVAKIFQIQLKKIVDKYFKLKDALVNDNAPLTKQKGAVLVNALVNVSKKLPTRNESHKKWMVLKKQIESSAKLIANSSDIKEQRNIFKNLSSYIIKSVQLFGINQKTYRYFCPMANNNKGAFWLSDDKKVRNPYYGKAMLKCGTVKQVINKN